MKIRRADLEGVLLIEPEIYRDDRGYFLETWREEYFQGSDISPPVSGRFVQENFSRSEEHTSELQSRGQVVCRLLLKKKKPIDNAKNKKEKAMYLPTLT